MNHLDGNPNGVFRHSFAVAEESIDQNGHVNNVAYVKWMQDVAIRHSDVCGGTAAIEALGCTWVVRAHRIEYLSPGRPGDTIEALTWVATLERVRSQRQYRFFRKSDRKLLARGETDWVFVNTQNWRPRAIPESVKACFPLVADFAPEDIAAQHYKPR